MTTALGDPLLAELELDATADCDCQYILDTLVEVDDLLTWDECDYFIDKADAFAEREGWEAEQHDKYATKDVKIRSLGDTPLRLFIKKVQDPLIDIIAREFKLPRHQVSVDDAFIVRYAIGPDEQRSLEWHRDGSIVSAIFSLSDPDEYIGGGTQFRDSMCYVPDKGSGIIFAGQRLHCGLKIQGGERYIATLFFRCGDLSCRKEAVAYDLDCEAKLRGETRSSDDDGIVGDLVGGFGSLMGWKVENDAGKREGMGS